MAKTAREAALIILERIRRSAAFSDALLKSVIKSEGLSQKDSGLCSKICYGVLQNRGLLDFYIDSFAEKPKNIEPKVRDILRISIYQILMMDKVPDHAAISEGVELTKKLGFKRASGFVNGMLRKVQRSREDLPKIPEKNKLKYLSIKYSHPIELVELLAKDFDLEFLEELLKANNDDAPLTASVNTLKTTTEDLKSSLADSGVKIVEHEFLKNSVNLASVGDLSSLFEHKSGLFYVQDAAAKLSIMALAPEKGSKILDACSAPGGKSFASAVFMENSGEIISCDLHENKLVRINEGAKRLGIKNIKTQAMDAQKPHESFENAFDYIIADVPCSGLGVIRKKPDIRYKNINELENLPKIQLSILEGLAPCLKSGGALLYSTCTILNRENGEVVKEFLENHSEFTLESFVLPKIGETSGMITLFPNVHGTDGFFISKLRKK